MPKPAKKRPANGIKMHWSVLIDGDSCENNSPMNIGWDVLAVSKITPKLKTNPVEAISPRFRPHVSAVVAADSAPEKVPAENIDAINESSVDVISVRLPVANSRFRQGIARMPLIVPALHLRVSMVVKSFEFCHALALGPGKMAYSFPNRTPSKARKRPTI